MTALLTKTFRIAPLLAAAALALGAGELCAQEVTWAVLASGAGRSTSDPTIAVAATAGQPVVGRISIGEDALHQGFWLPLQLTSGVRDIATGGTTRFELRSYPNPFTVATTVSYRLATAADVHLELLDMAGRPVATLVDRRQEAGLHHADWGGMTSAGLPAAAGMYLCRLTVDGESTARMKVLMVK